jgi:hypothetical protein
MQTDSLLVVVSVLVFNMNLKHTLKIITRVIHIYFLQCYTCIPVKTWYSSFHNFKKLGKEIGVLYIQTIDDDIYTSVILENILVRIGWTLNPIYK